MVQDRILEQGDMAFPETPVFTLALTDPIWVRAYISETDLGKIVKGKTETVPVVGGYHRSVIQFRKVIHKSP